MKFTIPLPPRTKKNSQRILRTKGGRPFIAPGQTYRDYEAAAGWYLRGLPFVDYPCNVRALYYMPTRGRVDLVNLHEALLDVLVHYGVLADDNSRIVAAMDGSRVLVDKAKPRTEVEITRLEG